MKRSRWDPEATDMLVLDGLVCMRWSSKFGAGETFKAVLIKAKKAQLVRDTCIYVSSRRRWRFSLTGLTRPSIDQERLH